MADANLNDEANYARLSRLLIDKGTEALRKFFDTFYSSSTLPTFIKKHHALLFKLKFKVINENQWDLLFPTSGNPDSKNFDISLLSVLLRSICGLKHPLAKVWSTTPPDTDRSQEANIARILKYRDEIYAHAANSKVTNDEFEHAWSKISQTLIELGVSKAEIEKLGDSPLGPDKESYIETLKDWKLQDDEIQKILDEEKISTRKLLKTTHAAKKSIPENTRKLQEYIDDKTTEAKESIAVESEAKKELIYKKQAESSGKQGKNLLLQLRKFNFDGDVKELVKLSHAGAREWIFKKVNDWFLEERSKVLVLMATPRVRESVLAAKITQAYKGYGQLAACHFCKFNNSNYSKPKNMIQSLASQICDSVKGFKEKLLKQLTRIDKVKTLQDAVQVYLKEPLQYLPRMKPMLLVIDGLGECRWKEKTDLLEVLAKEFSKLPTWLKVLITNQPEINVKEKIGLLESIEILFTGESNEEDVKEYLTLEPSERVYKQSVSKLTEKCNDTYLYTSHPRKRGAKITEEDVPELFPKTLNEAYRSYFERFETKLKEKDRKYNTCRLLKIIAVAYQPIPLSLFTEGLELAPNLQEMKQIIENINETISSLLYVSDESVTVFHNSVVDWLLQKHHDYTVDLKEADKLLWEMMENKFNEARKNFETEENGSSICSLAENTAMQYVLKHGFQHLFRAANYIDVRFEWLVDVFVLHLMTTGESCEPCMEAWQDFLRLANDYSNSTMKEIRQKVSWYYEHFSKYEVRPIYVQDIFNEGPHEIFNSKEKDIAKKILDRCLYFWCEKLGYLNLTALVNHVTACAFSPDGLNLVSCAKDGRIWIWNIDSLQIVEEVSSNCKNAIRCFWSEGDEILIYHYAEDAEGAEDDLMLSRYTVQLAKKSDKKLAKKNDVPLAFSLQAFIFKCSADSSIRVYRFIQTNGTLIRMPYLGDMDKFAITRDGSSILAANKDHYEIWNIRATTSTEYNKAKSENFELSTVTHKDCECITEVLNCTISSNQKHGIISYLCSQRSREEPYILVIDMDVDRPRNVDDINLPYPIRDPTYEKLHFEVIEGNNDVIVTSGDDDDDGNDDNVDDDDDDADDDDDDNNDDNDDDNNHDDDDDDDDNDDDDSDKFYFVQSYKRITVYSNKCMGPLTHFNHNGDPDYYKDSSICRSGNIMALPQKSGGICIVKLHLPKTNWKNFGSRIAAFRWNMQCVSMHSSVL